MGLIANKVIHYSTHVSIVLVDFETTTSTTTTTARSNLQPLLDKLRTKLSNNQSLPTYIEHLVRRAEEQNLYTSPQDEASIMVVMGNILSKYYHYLERVKLRERNAKLVLNDDHDGDENNLSRIHALYPFSQLMTKTLMSFDWKTMFGGPYGAVVYNESPHIIKEVEVEQHFLKILMSSTMKSCFFLFLTMSKRHQRSDRLNYIRFSLYFVHTQPETHVEDCFNSSLESEHLTCRNKNDYPLKVVLVMGKNSMEWTEHGFIQVEDVNCNSKIEVSCCLKKAFLVCRHSDKINYYMNKLVDFNCKWNASMFYHPTHCNTGHYAKSLLSFMNISLGNQEAKTLLDCICENSNIPFTFNIPCDLIHISQFKSSLSTFLKDLKRKPEWVDTILEPLSNNAYEDSIKLNLSSDLDEIHSFYSFFLPYLTKCPSLEVVEEFSFYLLALLESNRGVLRGEWYESSLLPIARCAIHQIVVEGRSNHTYHAPVYNFCEYSSFKNSLLEVDTSSGILSQLLATCSRKSISNGFNQ